MVNVLMIEDDSEFATLLSEYLSKFNIIRFFIPIKV